jgi:phosphatidylserine/phosphatidylglycerophosphate/cardiolipin synthase-like enzyme
MERLLEAVSALVAQVSPSKVESLASEIAKIKGAGDASRLASWANNPVAKSLFDGVILAWQSTNVTSSEVAGMLAGASYAYQLARKEESVELVWTGPATELVATRRTEQALLEVIQAARKDLFLVSFVAYEVPVIMEALSDAIGRGVKVSMLVESSDEHGGTLSVDSVRKMREALPGCAVYVWSSAKKLATTGGHGSVHAKCSVADGRIAFITSANLTAAALERNMEMGVLVRGDRLPKQLHEHLQALVTTGIII